MNLWQVWLTLSEIRNKSLSPVGTETVSVVADSNRVGSHLVADLSRGLNHSLDNRGVSHSTNGGKGSGGNHWGVGVWEGTKNHSRISLSVPLDNSVGKGKSVAKTMVASVSCHRGNSGSGNNRGGMMDHREDRGVVDQGSGCAEDSGASSNDSRISIPLDNGVGEGKSVAKTMVAETGITHSGNSGSGNNRGMDDRADRGVVDQGGGCAEDGGASSNDGRIGVPLDNSVGKGKSVAKTMVAKTGITNSGNSGSSNNRGMDHRADRGVVDQGGGRGEDLGVSSKDSRISLPLAVVAIAVVANSNGHSVGSHLMADLSRGHLNGLDDRVAGNGANRGKAEGCRSSNHWGSGVWEGCVEQLRIGLRGGRCRSNDC